MARRMLTRGGLALASLLSSTALISPALADTITQIVVPGAAPGSPAVTAISPNGQYEVGTFQLPGFGNHIFLDSNGVVTDAGHNSLSNPPGVSNTGNIFAQPNPPASSVVGHGPAMTPEAVSPDGQYIVGEDAASHFGFIFDTTTNSFTAFDTSSIFASEFPGLIPSTAQFSVTGVNDLGEIVGSYFDGTTTELFAGLLNNFTTLFPGSPAGIDNLGDIAFNNLGNPYLDTIGSNTPPADPVIEPSSLALMGAALLGMAGLLGYRRRREGVGSIA